MEADRAAGRMVTQPLLTLWGGSYYTPYVSTKT